MTISVFLLTLGLVARVTRFLTDDIAGSPIRSLIIRVFGDESKLYVWATCAWCAGAWFAAGGAVLGWYCGETAAYQIVAIAATISWVYAILATWLDGSKFVLEDD